MDINYTYELIESDDENKCALFLFKSEGLPEQLVSVRYPFEEEDYLQVISQHAPVYYWILLKKKVKKFPEPLKGVVKFSEGDCDCPECEEKKARSLNIIEEEGSIPCTTI